MNQRSKIILISVLSVILGVVCLLTGKSFIKPVVPVRGADPTPVPTVVAYDPTKAEGTAANPFTILEIVPNYSHAQIGYLIDGQEPVKVYGTGGILENARAGYQGAYDFLEKLSEYTVTGPKGDLGGSGEGTGGGSRTIYAFDDEKSKFESMGEVPAGATWEQSAEKIERVTGYYTVATQEEIDNTTLTKFKLEQKKATGAGDTSGIDGRVYEAEDVLSGFKSASREGRGDYDRYQITSYNSGMHRWKDWATQQSAQNLMRYNQYRDGSRYRYEYSESGRFIYYNGYLYYANSGGDYVAVYSTGYCVYVMTGVGTGVPAGSTETYYIYHTPLGYEDNKAYFDGAYSVDNTIWIEGTSYNGYLDTENVFYYTYTIEEEEGGVAFVFEDEKSPGVEYDLKGSTERAGSYVEVDFSKRNNSAIQKYEYIRMLKTDAAGYGWISANWSDKGLDGKEYSKDALIGFKVATQEEKDTPGIQKYDKPSNFVPALDSTDKGSDNSRYVQKDAAESDKIVGTPVEWATYKYIPAGTEEYVAKPDGWTGETYNYDFKYVSAATPTGSGYTIPSGTDSDELWFLTFSKSGSGKKYSATGAYRLDDEEDSANRYFYEKDGSEYDLLSGVGYTGETNGETTGFLWWQTFDNNNNYLITFTQNDSEASPYYVVDAVPYASTGNTNRNRIASMLYTKQDIYTKAEGATGQYIKSVDRYEKAADGTYIYYDGHLYIENATGNYVLYKAVSGQGDGTNYYYFGSEFYRKNPAGGYVAEYDFREKTGGEYIYWLRPVDQDYVDANPGTTFYFREGLSYADNKKYFNDEAFKNEVTEAANWKLVDTKEESYFAKRPVDPDAPVVIPTDTVNIVHSNVFLKNVMNFAYQNNDPTKPLEVDQFKFAGWYTEPECINKYDFENAVLRANITLYAKWIPKTDGDRVYVDTAKYPKAYTVKFFAKGSDTTESYKVENINTDLDLSLVSYVPVYEKAVGDTKDYLFQGWSTKKNGIEADIITTVSYTNTAVSLYPVWKVMDVADADTLGDAHKVEFYVTKDGATSVIKTLEVYENGYIKTEDGVAPATGKYMAAVTPEAKEDKVFAGWYTEATPEFASHVPYTFGVPVKEDVKLYACWIEEALLADETTIPGLTIAFDGNLNSVKDLLLDAEKQVVEEVCTDIKYPAFKADGTPIEVKPLTVHKTPHLMGNVQFKASNYKVEVQTMLPADLNSLTADELDELLDKADMIVIGNSNQHTDYSDIFSKYAVKRGGSNSYTSSNDLKFNVATAIFKKSMEAGSAPVMLDKTLLNYRTGDTAKYNVYKLFVMLQAMDASMFYDSFLKAGATNVSTSELWTRIDTNGKYGTSERWHCETFINALGLASDDKIYYGIDKNQDFLSSAGYPTSLTNHSYVYSGEVFKTGTEFTKNVIAEDAFYTENLFDYFNGKKAAVENKYAPADAVNYMVFGYQPEVGLDETTAILELQPEHTFKNFKFWYLFVKKYIPNYSGKLIVDCKNTQKTMYLGNAVDDNCETLTVRQMGSLEFVGLISDLNSDYRMIYIGGDLSGDNADEMRIDGNYYAYLHTGNTRTNLYEKVLGVLGGDKDTLNISCYPGNDITAVKMRELYEFCAVANSPIIIDDSLFSNVAESKINTNLMDSSSNLYQLFTNDTNGLLGTAPCYAEGNVDYDTMSALMNEDRVRLLVSSVPPTYKEGQGDSLNYLNPQNQESRVLEYKFVLQGKQDTKYKVRLFIDMNADGQFNRATEMLDSLVIRTGRTILSNRATLEAGKEYTVQRSISDYVGVMPWKLEVYEVDNESVRHSVTGMTAIKPVKKNDEGTGFVKEKLNILQVTSAKDDINKYGENNAYMPTTKEMEDLDALGDTYKGKKYSQLTNNQRNTVNSILSDVSSSGSNRQIAYDFWVYLSSLKEFDISITRVSLSELAEGIREGHLNDEGVDFKMDNFNMLIMGFADCYNEITDEASLVAVEDFIESGKSVLFTHDCSSFLNYSKQRVTNSRFYATNSGLSYWGYNINKRFRNMLGMDRYGVTLMYGNEKVENENFYFANVGNRTIPVHTTSLMGTLNEAGFVAGAAYEEIAQEMAKKDVLYKYNNNQEKIWLDSSGDKAYVQGYTRLLLKDDDNGVEGYTSTNVSNVNAGQITRYPFTIPDNFSVASTHSQYYQLDLEANDIVVWYCLADNSGVFNQFYNDARNNYYIYSKGNIMYTGVGHSGGLSENEIKLFINTMVAAYAASADPTAPKIINFDRTTGADEIDYLYVDYDTTFPELAIGDGVEGVYNENPANNTQTKEVNFKLTENSIVTNKLMTVYVYEYISTNAEGKNNYEPLPMEMEVQKYNSDDSTSPVEGIPVFVVNTDLVNASNPEYTYSKGQVLAIDSNIMVQEGSITGTSVTIGGITYPLTPSGNGYYYDYNNNGTWDSGDVISYKALSKLDDKGLPVYSSSDVISGYIYIAPIVDAGEEYVFKAPIGALVDKDMVPYKLHVNLRYGKRQDKTKDGFKELSVVRRGLFNLD